jgi:hypothetical protein
MSECVYVTYTCAHARAHTQTHANLNPHPFSLLLPDQGVEGRAQERVRRCARWRWHGIEADG